MGRYANWVEAEWAGEFERLEDALQEAVVVAYARRADVIVADELMGAEWLVDVRELKQPCGAAVQNS
jgi:hypothetical protein